MIDFMIGTLNLLTVSYLNNDISHLLRLFYLKEYGGKWFSKGNYHCTWN